MPRKMKTNPTLSHTIHLSITKDHQKSVKSIKIAKAFQHYTYSQEQRKEEQRIIQSKIWLVVIVVVMVKEKFTILR